MKSKTSAVRSLLPLLVTLLASAGFAFGQSGLIAPATAAVGETVLVKYNDIGVEGGQITLGLADGSSLPGANPADLSGEVSGSVEILMPEVAGNYTVLYINGVKTLASRPITVGVAPVAVVQTEVVETVVVEEPAVGVASIEAPTSIRAGYSFQVNWKGPAEVGDRLILVDPATPAATISYTFLDPLSPTAVLRAPGQAGQFELQYRTAAGQTLVKQSINVLAAPTELVSLVVKSDATTNLNADNAVSVILDASGSMLQDQGGEDRIEIAKDTLLAFMKESIPAGTPFSLRAFGHIEEGSCESELLIPLAPFDYEGMAPIVREIQAINLAKTPIADSLKMIPSDLQGVTGQQTIVLLTDGEETCEGNPAAIIRGLRANGANVRVNIVGYAIDQDELRENFESWAAIGDGRYFDAPQGAELATALRGAVAIPYGLYSELQLVATGVTGQTQHQLAPGDYEILYRLGGAEVRKSFIVTSEAINEITIP